MNADCESFPASFVLVKAKTLHSHRLIVSHTQIVTDLETTRPSSSSLNIPSESMQRTRHTSNSSGFCFW